VGGGGWVLLRSDVEKGAHAGRLAPNSLRSNNVAMPHPRHRSLHMPPHGPFFANSLRSIPSPPQHLSRRSSDGTFETENTHKTYLRVRALYLQSHKCRTSSAKQALNAPGYIILPHPRCTRAHFCTCNYFYLRPPFFISSISRKSSLSWLSDSLILFFSLFLVILRLSIE